MVMMLVILQQLRQQQPQQRPGFPLSASGPFGLVFGATVLLLSLRWTFKRSCPLPGLACRSSGGRRWADRRCCPAGADQDLDHGQEDEHQRQ